MPKVFRGFVSTWAAAWPGAATGSSLAAALFTDPTGIATLFLGLLALAIATVAYNIYQAIGKAQAVGKAVKSAA